MRRPVRRVLSPAERQAIEAQLQDRQIQMNTPTLMLDHGRPVWAPGSNDGLTRPGIVSYEAKRLKKLLDEGAPPDLSKQEIIERDKEIRRLEESLKKKLVPRRHYHQKADDSSGYRKVVNTLVSQASDKKLADDLARLKALRRERDPNDPDAGNLEYLRKD